MVLKFRKPASKTEESKFQDCLASEYKPFKIVYISCRMVRHRELWLSELGDPAQIVPVHVRLSWLVPCLHYIVHRAYAFEYMEVEGIEIGDCVRGRVKCEMPC